VGLAPFTAVIASPSKAVVVAVAAVVRASAVVVAVAVATSLG
jgi:hypothetical protein